ncbi:MAG: hypothetical protein DRI86_00880 [Bacteroidetes bacterium]|nr:MAG: hypothetical protein DRI86_00880 [Bacteroidota bacterium]
MVGNLTHAPQEHNTLYDNLLSYSKNQKHLIKFHTIMKDKLYSTKTQACNHKSELEYYVKPKDTNEALHHNFIKYGNKAATSFVIIDVDHNYETLEDFNKNTINTLKLEPSWISKTSKGFHVGFILSSPVFSNDASKHQQLVFTKVMLTNLLNGDIAGSYRVRGYWRNPLTHHSIVNTNTFDIDSLHKKISQLFALTQVSESIDGSLIIKSDENKRINSVSNWENIDKTGFVPGNRNNYLFHKTLGMLHNGIIKRYEIEDTLRTINNKQLPESEILNIAKSLSKYKYNPKGTDIKDRYIHKKGEYFKSLSLNEIHNYRIKNGKVSFERQKVGQVLSTAKIITNSISKLVDGYCNIYKSKSKFTNNNISNESNMSIPTIKRYRNKRKLEQNIKEIAFKKYIFSIVNINTIVNADEPLLNKMFKNVVNLALESLKYCYKNTTMYFIEYSDKNKLLLSKVPTS